MQPIKDVHKCPVVSSGCYTRCYIYRLCHHIPFWQVSLKFNKSLGELHANKAPFFQKISIWQEILFVLLERGRKSSLCHDEFVLLMYSCLNLLDDNTFIVLQKISSGNQCWFSLAGVTVCSQLMDQRDPLRGVSDRGQQGRKKGANECSGFLTSQQKEVF